MLPYFEVEFSNPSNSYHYAGRKAFNSIEEAREKVAALISANAKEIIFTSGATESNNLAILGVARSYRGNRRKIVTTPIEHKSVLKSFEYLATHGFNIEYLPVDSTGTVTIEEAKEIIDETTLLVSIQAANNEIGTIQPVNEVSSIAQQKGALVHCDAAQAVGKIQIDVSLLGVDYLSISSHKLYGPKGVGALFLKKKRKLTLEPLFWGGDQEQGLRPGTYNVPGVVGFGEACSICKREMEADTNKIGELRGFLEDHLKKSIPIRINGKLKHRLPGNSNITFPGVEGDALLLNLPQLALSIGSACNTGAIEPSYVLTAIGLSREDANSSIRIGIGRFTTQSEILSAINYISAAYWSLLKR
jgi:cysteine desulfurase